MAFFVKNMQLKIFFVKLYLKSVDMDLISVLGYPYTLGLYFISFNQLNDVMWRVHAFLK